MNDIISDSLCQFIVGTEGGIFVLDNFTPFVSAATSDLYLLQRADRRGQISKSREGRESTVENAAEKRHRSGSNNWRERTRGMKC